MNQDHLKEYRSLTQTVGMGIFLFVMSVWIFGSGVFYIISLGSSSDIIRIGLPTIGTILLIILVYASFKHLNDLRAKVESLIFLQSQIANLSSCKEIKATFIKLKSTEINILGAQWSSVMVPLLDMIMKGKISRFISLSTSYIEEILTDSYTDLDIRMQNIIASLMRAKSEVEKNLTGTPELLAVSEAQKKRLDEQIRQFEELQKRIISL